MNHFLYLAGNGLVVYAVWAVIVAGPANLSRENTRITSNASCLEYVNTSTKV